MNYDDAYRIASSYDYNRNYQIDSWELYVDPAARNRLTYRPYGDVSVQELASGLARNDVYIGADRAVHATGYPYPPPPPPYYPPPPPYYPPPYYPQPPHHYPPPPPHHHYPYPHRASADAVVGNTIGGTIAGGLIGGIAGGRQGAVNGAVIGGTLGLVSGLLH